MAREQTRTSRPSASDTDSERQDGERVILRQAQVIELPDNPEKAAAIMEAAKGIKGTTAWIEVDRVTARDKTSAIKAHAGEPGTPDAKPGTYKAPPLSAFKGGMEYERPERPKVEARPLED